MTPAADVIEIRFPSASHPHTQTHAVFSAVKLYLALQLIPEYLGYHQDCDTFFKRDNGGP